MSERLARLLNFGLTDNEKLHIELKWVFSSPYSLYYEFVRNGFTGDPMTYIHDTGIWLDALSVLVASFPSWFNFVFFRFVLFILFLIFDEVSFCWTVFPSVIFFTKFHCSMPYKYENGFSQLKMKCIAVKWRKIKISLKKNMESLWLNWCFRAKLLLFWLILHFLRQKDDFYSKNVIFTAKMWLKR